MYTDGIWFKDDEGRTLILRGANVSGSTKIPVLPKGITTWGPHNFFDYKHVSFIGRPFPIAEAEEHFKRLKSWGLTFLRLLVTWEAIEHEGPGIYDENYLDYIQKIVELAGNYGIQLFIDPHQDVWSRWTGGDGAPAWTLEKLGMQIENLDSVGASYVHLLHDGPIPKMFWPTNYNRFGAATMFTLFYGGNIFAPCTRIDGERVQEYLQQHYINAIKQVALRVKNYSHVVGFEAMNEPHNGYIGYKDISRVAGYFDISGTKPTPFQAMCAASGYPQNVDFYKLRFTSLKPVKPVTINYFGKNLWKPGYDCVWKQNGVWTDVNDKPELLQPNYFQNIHGKQVNFAEDFLKPFVKRYTNEIREIQPKSLIFIEDIPYGEYPTWSEEEGKGIVNACHWYDGFTLFTKHFSKFFNLDTTTRKFIFGRKNIFNLFVSQLASIKKLSNEKMGNIPTFIGEFGLPFDLNKKKGYRTGDFSEHTQALNMYYNAMDKNFLGCTIWNYTVENRNRWGDTWNDEDLSIFSRDQQSNRNDINSGARGLMGFCRPYARKISGTPLHMQFRMHNKNFYLKYRHDPQVTEPTEIFIPNVQYPNGIEVEISDGTWKYDQEEFLLTVYHTTEQEIHEIKVKPIL